MSNDETSLYEMFITHFSSMISRSLPESNHKNAFRNYLESFKITPGSIFEQNQKCIFIRNSRSGSFIFVTWSSNKHNEKNNFIEKKTFQ